jgi:hypothetical protein
MKRLITITILAALCGCERDRPARPATRYISYDEQRLEHALGRVEQRAVELGAHREVTTRLQVVLGRQRLRVAIAGDRIGNDVAVCRIHISSNELRRPLPLDVLYALIDDPRVAEHLRNVTGELDTRRAYRCVAEVDGLDVRLEQLQGIDGPTIDLVLDGCVRESARADGGCFDGWDELEFPT